jgi:hypothetical protein
MADGGMISWKAKRSSKSNGWRSERPTLLSSDMGGVVLGGIPPNIGVCKKYSTRTFHSRMKGETSGNSA